MNKRTHTDTKTSELLDLMNDDIPMEDDKGQDNIMNARDELETRRPFQALKSQINNLKKRINDLESEVESLKRHGHDSHTGQPVEPLQKKRFY